MTPTPHMSSQEVEHDLIRAIANALQGCTELAQRCPDEAHARELLFNVLGRRCSCGASAKLKEAVCCDAGHRRSLTSLSFRHSKLPLRVWVAAIWHLHVDDRAIAARGFARTYRVDKMSAWRLLMRVRAAIPLMATYAPAAKVQTMGHQARSNLAHCHIGLGDGGRVTALDAGRGPGGSGRHPPAGPLIAGHFRAWLACVFHGVHRRYQDDYLAEFIDRQHR
jgi:hypothetical protein